VVGIAEPVDHRRKAMAEKYNVKEDI